MAEAYFVKDRHAKDNANCHIILAAKTRKGIGDLNMALSEANISGYYYRPRVDMDLLLALDPRDVFVTTACVGGLFKYGFADAERLIVQLAAHYRDSFMLEVQNHDTDKQKEVNSFLLRLYRKHGIPLIAGLDSHYILPEDAALRNLRLEANGIQYDDEDKWYMDYPSDDEARSRFAVQGILSDAQIREAMENTNVFLSFEDVELSKARKLPTLYPALTQQQRNQKYLDIVQDEWARFSEGMSAEEKAVREEGIAYETDVVTSTNMSDYFLLDYEIVKRAKEKGGVLTTTGRGSGVSFFTNTLLGFSSVDRFAIPVEMYPDRFISADRILSGSLPDLDLNCANEDVFIEAQSEIMGEWRSAPMVAFGTMRRLSAWKMYCRANDVPFEQANAMSDRLREYELAVKHAGDDEKDTVSIGDYVPAEFSDLVRESERYLGMIDSISPHPCAHLLCCEDIRREIGIIRLNAKGGKKKTIYAAFIDGQTAERYGYLKNDMLHVDVVKINRDVFQRAGVEQPAVGELLSLTRNDRETWRIYESGFTMGLNQVERDKTREKVMRYKPRNITELSAFVAAVRPSFQSMIQVFLARQRFSYNIPVFDKLIQTREMPSSFILYQEQVMKTLQYGGFSAPESYAAIKAIAKKHPEKVLPLKQRFLDGFSAQVQVDDPNCAPPQAKEMAAKVWQIIDDATAYGFNSCLSGSVRIRRASRPGKYEPTIEEMYRIRDDRAYAASTGHANLHSKYRSYGYGNALSMFSDGRIRKNRIVDIRYAGVAKTYRVTTATGATIICTDNHKFPTPAGEMELSQLHIGDALYRCGSYEKNTAVYPYTNGMYTPNYPKKGQCGFQTHSNGASALFHRARKTKIEQRCSCEVCGRPYEESTRFEMHHKDGNRTNNSSENLVWSCVSCHKKAHYTLGRTRHMEKGYPTLTDPIVSIDFVCEEDVYDVEMGEPAHNFVVESGIVTSNSHAVCVALDSLYGAYAKSHYPLEYYTALLSLYSVKGDKDRIALVKEEMKRAFGIRVVPCRFRQDNRDFYIDHEGNAISDALTSVKHIGKRVAGTLFDWRDRRYACFTDLLRDMEDHSSFDLTSITILIRMGYFAEFGSTGKLLRLYDEFRMGEYRYSKTHVVGTRNARLDMLRDVERHLPESEVPIDEQISFEIAHYGTMLSIFPDMKAQYAVVDVDDKYSPKLKLYNLSNGNTGVMKMRKSTYAKSPLMSGDRLKLIEWSKKPAFQYVGGKQVRRDGAFDLWLNCHEKLS